MPPIRFTQSQRWLDDQGNQPINAHGGGFLFHEDRYYWFGEHIEGRQGGGARPGFSCYSSPDLLHWRNNGLAFDVGQTMRENPALTRLERPKVIYNRRTGQFVMWFHLEDVRYQTARSGVAVADRVTGPYTFLHGMRPNAGRWPRNVTPAQQDPASIARARERGEILNNGENPETPTYNILGRDFAAGQQARDMTIFLDEDGSAYHVYSSEHNSTLHIAKLTGDYLHHSGEYVRVFENRWMEAPCLVKYNRRYYFLGSGCTGYAPNAARSAVADSIWGPWRELGNPCCGVSSLNGQGPDTTFGGQSTYIIPVQGQYDAFIAAFDVWMPEGEVDFGYYFFLPMKFNGEGFSLTWQDQWDLSVFD